MAAPRALEQRIRDVRHRLEHDVDAWIATADPETATPYLVPLSFLWFDDHIVLSTAAAAPTSRNLQATPTVRLGIGPTRDVVIVDGAVEVVAVDDLAPDVGDRFAAATGFDPRTESSAYLYFRVRPVRIQAWREANEIAGRDVMVDGRWRRGDAPA